MKKKGNHPIAVEQNEILIGGIADADKKGEKRGKRRGGNFLIHIDNA